MTPDQAIKLELLLIVVALVAFWIWQTVSLRRDQRALQARREAERRARQAAGADEAGAAETTADR